MRSDGQAKPSTRYRWRVFWVLLIAGVLAGVAALPYILALFGNHRVAAGGLPTSLAALALVEALQLSLAFGIICGVGLLLAPKVGIRTPLLDAWLYGRTLDRAFPWRTTIAAGVATGLLIAVGIYGFMAPRVPHWPSEAHVPIWMRVSAAIYGGIDEELLMRFFLLALALWIVQKIRRRSGDTDAATFWIANIIVALIFGLAYLPAAAALVEITKLVCVMILSINFVAGLVFGYLARFHGLEAAMIAHFVANVIAHLLGPAIAL